MAKRIITCALFCFLLSADSSDGAVHFVPDDFPSIQGAINASANSDTIIVRSGTYVENLDFLGKAITVRSEFGPGTTVIDGNQAGTVVTFQSGEGSNSVIDGFTITNGSGTVFGSFGFKYGGGIFCNWSSSPLIQNNIISGNSAKNHGGGISCVNYSNPMIANNTVINNMSEYGAGIDCFYYSSPTITGTTVQGNTAGALGGGIQFTDHCSPAISGSTIKENFASKGGGISCGMVSVSQISGNTISGNTAIDDGGGVYCYYSNPVLSQNTITENTAARGAGLFCSSVCSPEIVDNTIFGNTALDSGGGICCWSYVSPVISNNTIAENAALGFEGKGGGIFATSNAFPEIIGNLVSSNTALEGGGVYCEDGSDATISGNIIDENQGSSYGGGIACSGSDPLITGNTIVGNATSLGGGIFCSGPCSPKICRNTLAGNSADMGGGIHCISGVTGEIENNTISGNLSGQFGGGIFFGGGSSPTVVNNMITCNSSGWGGAYNGSGGGVYCGGASSPELTCNTIACNTAECSGGGIYCRYYCSVAVYNTILWNNDAPSGEEIFLDDGYHPSALSISSCDVDGGQAAVHVDSGCTLAWGAGMIDSDPLFVDAPGNDFHLFYTSPCKDAGDNSAPGLLPGDFEDDPRTAYGLTDMGADEFYRHLYCTGELVPGGAVEVKLVGDPGAGPACLWYGPNVMENPVTGAYGDWYLLPPLIFIGPLPPIPAEGVEVLSGNIPSSPPAPYSIHMQALINQELSNLCTIEIK